MAFLLEFRMTAGGIMYSIYRFRNNKTNLNIETIPRLTKNMIIKTNIAPNKERI